MVHVPLWFLQYIGFREFLDHTRILVLDMLGHESYHLVRVGVLLLRLFGEVLRVGLVLVDVACL